MHNKSQMHFSIFAFYCLCNTNKVFPQVVEGKYVVHDEWVFPVNRGVWLAESLRTHSGSVIGVSGLALRVELEDMLSTWLAMALMLVSAITCQRDTQKIIKHPERNVPWKHTHSCIFNHCQNKQTKTHTHKKSILLKYSKSCSGIKTHISESEGMCAIKMTVCMW